MLRVTEWVRERRPRRAVGAVALALVVAGSMLPGLASGQTTGTGRVVVDDVTAISDCTIRFARYKDNDYTDVVSSTGDLPCGTDGAVIHTRFVSGEGGGGATGDAVVDLSGDVVLDGDAIEQAIDAVSAVQEAPILDDGDDSGGGGATTCQVGSYPANWQVSGSYVVYEYDGGPKDTRMRYRVRLKRTTCNSYYIREVSSWLDAGDPAGQRLWLDQYHYTYAFVGGANAWGTRRIDVCQRHPSGSGRDTRITDQPNNFTLLPYGTFKIWTTNSGVDNCWFWGETWTGEVSFSKLPNR